jgi:hypothetical protein
MVNRILPLDFKTPELTQMAFPGQQFPPRLLDKNSKTFSPSTISWRSTITHLLLHGQDPVHEY